jgi:hypothetical protein
MKIAIGDKMHILKRIWSKVRYSPLLRLVLDGLSKIGIRITPYYIVSEGLFNRSIPHLETGFDEYDLGFLGPNDMKEISLIPDINIPEKELLIRLKEGKKCFGVKYKGELVAFTWCDFIEYTCNDHRFLLKENEACLFDAYTLMSFRGKGIAPYIRYQCYKELYKMGRHRLYSISDYLNTPSIRFKMKLDAKLLELFLYIGLFKKWHLNLRLKRFKVEI